ncbi:hypothetical protein SLEP1_g57844 [Rubroshorea leprosula]|uniref:Uncharacterized protein n=1 Tax=Rubroshorea leprosula TaxID=152421 RepID=A0AAV5MQA4_9ROSI|nr:hypothetical protein SLEP1_g57844 [Rubroshorea leprosula]
MSSEEMVSVGGSEEVRALEYGDVSMTSESFGSEGTEEGVGRGEVVGVEGDRVPITVVEVEGMRERCYDIDADIVSEVKQYESELETRDSLYYFVESYEISSRVLIRPAGVEERACSAPRDHWMPVYAHYLAAGLRFPIPELLVGGSRKDKGWYYFTPRVSNRESRSLFTAGPSSIKGWKEKFFFVDDIEWERGDAEVELLSSWKAKKANQNKYSLNENEEEEVGKLVREGAKLANIMCLTNAECIEAAELYGPSALSEGGGYSKEAEEEVKDFNQGSGGGRSWEGRKKKVVEEEVRGSEVLQFVPRPPLVELDPELRESEVEGAEAKNATRARRSINATFPEVDKCKVRDEALRYCGATVMKHALEKEKEELEKKNKDMQETLDEVVPAMKQLEQKRDSLSTKLVFEEKKWKISESKSEAQKKEIKAMKEAVVELKKNVQLLVHNEMEEHISNFVNSSSFDNIVNLYRLLTAILAFTDCRKKVKAEYPKVDITKITFCEQEEGVEENGESMSADFCPQIQLRWDHDAEGRTVFHPNFDFEFVAVEEEETEVKETEVGAGAGGAEVDES